ncbi:bifunctional riboflavin kinase/FAD synthetase [Actinocorallia aurantiaca]|uniref:Riboflavin biosynthesis protein n=1 Tax=Actinocorallia aurantiaca TaxID=46204 RepID=A0ABP6HAM4_9ACTN
MRRWYGLDEVPRDWGRSVVTIGVFDGVHRGHQKVIGRAAELAAELGLPCVVVTFDPHPDEVVRPGSHPPLLSSGVRRPELLAEVGADAIMVLPFTLELSRMGPDEFVQSILVDRLHAARVIVGEDFRFGHRAKGDIALLRELGEKYDFLAEGVPLVADGDTISSTAIRARLAEGAVEEAAHLLGRPHRVEGIVVRGHQRGRALGFPTANVESLPHTAVPADGVYAGYLVCDSERYPDQCWPAAISVGTNPTFEAVVRTVEAYALDRDDLDLYGEHVSVDFVSRIRGMVKFESIEDLIAEMRRDVERAREVTRS